MAMEIYAEVTNKIVSMLEAGVVPWRSPILAQSTPGGAGWPKNLDSGRDYRGVNVFLLAFTAWCNGYSSPNWLTFNQAKAKGGSVRRGEKASMVVFWKSYKTKDKATEEPVTVPVLRYFNVFNLEQCEGITVPTNDAPASETTVFTPIEAAERLVSGFEGRPEIEHRGNRAYYIPKLDTIHVPPPSKCVSPEAFYATVFHELGHASGHSSRLNRGIDTQLAPFGSPEYAREELIAEMTAAFLCGHTGIAPETVENSASYIASWIKTLKGDKRLAVSAAGAAQRAADWIRGIRPQAGGEQTRDEQASEHTGNTHSGSSPPTPATASSAPGGSGVV